MVAALIELQGIRRSFGGESGAPAVDVLRGISLSIQAGEFVAIVGTSGSGKSTLMNLLGCLDRPSAGSYRFAGEDVAAFDADQLAWLRREAFGFVFQGYHLIATESARENVEVPAIYAGMPSDQRRERASALLRRLGLDERLEHRPAQLSGGQQQRVSIARALMNGGRIILADEPTGALDSRSGEEVMALLHELADAGHTIILITHDRDVAAQARRVIEIRDGQIISDSGALVPSNALPAPDMRQAGRASGASFFSEFGEMLRGAWRVLLIHRFRTALTLLGIVIGVASVIVMLAVGEGAKQKVVAEMGVMGANMMYVSSDVPRTGGPTGVLTADDFDAIGQLREVSRVMPILRDPALIRHGQQAVQSEVLGVGEHLPQIHRWPVARGRFFSAAENHEIAAVAVLGHQVYQSLFPEGDDPLGAIILINSSPFEVIGVMSEKGSDAGGNYPDEQVLVPHRTGVVRVFPKLRDESYGGVEVMRSELVGRAQASLEELLLQRHGRQDFRVYNSAAKLQAEAETRQSMTLMLGLIAAVSLLVGGIGVMNVMLMTVRERTREIGIRMATGARQRDILRQFLTESVLVTLVGGSVGVITGLLFGALLIAWNVPLVFSLSAMLLAFVCSVGTGLVFGYLPAKTAAQLDPVVALAQ
ncbi:macrolide transport system ATP-binding/permease protein [Pseudomonas flavescens]|uniref:Pyoverdine export ATP-binding/permease protein PvdT n=1 Tax=Phytopseudomonas flavescens TaxID=29435 RepID=A0A1G8A9S1_9GAMM|nr:MacB family efflux pump subunit [Pseudomonas flavescens]SDH17678.1 macrolide transport system ATP-binding/permease protein [Pseudomonas flavescens]